MFITYLALIISGAILIRGAFFWRELFINPKKAERGDPEITSPPRVLSRDVKIGLLFGKRSTQLYCAFFVAVLLILMLVIHNNRGALQIEKGKSFESTGHITKIQKRKKKGGKDPVQYYYQINFIHDAGTKRVVSSCNLPGATDPVTPPWSPGDEVTLRQSIDFPDTVEVTSIPNCDLESLSALYFFGVTCLIFMILLIVIFLQNRKVCRLLQYGIFDYGILIQKKHHTGKYARWDLVFEYVYDDQSYHHRLTVSSEREVALLTDKEQQALFFNPDQPEEVVMFDYPEKVITISEGGQFITTETMPLFLILPLIAVVYIVAIIGLLFMV